MKANVDLGGLLLDVIEFEPFLGADIEKYTLGFNNWYYEHTVEYGIGVLQQRSDLPYKSLSTQVVLDWMYEVAPECNAKLIATDIKLGEEDTSLPYMYLSRFE